MIDTTLPYDISKLNDIRENGAHVKISGADFSRYTDEDNTFTTMVYLRNTNFVNVQLDFNGVSYAQKEKMMLIYMTEDMKIDNHEFSDALYDILFMKLDSAHTCNNAIFDKDDICKFIVNSCDQVCDYLTYLKSLSLFVIDRIKALEDSVANDVEHVDTENVVGSNILNIIKDSRFDELQVLLSKRDDIPLRFYTKDFTIENNELFNALKNTTYGFLIEAILEETKCHAQ